MHLSISLLLTPSFLYSFNNSSISLFSSSVGGIEVNPLNSFIKDYYSSLKGEELNVAEINILSSIENAEKLVSSCKNNLEKKDITEQEIKLLNNTIKDTEYQINSSREIIKLIQSIKVKERSKNAKKLI